MDSNKIVRGVYTFHRDGLQISCDMRGYGVATLTLPSSQDVDAIWEKIVVNDDAVIYGFMRAILTR